MKGIILKLFCSLLLPNLVFGQTQTFVKSIAYPVNTELIGSVRTDDQSFVLLQKLASGAGPGLMDFMVTKIQSSGSIQWSHTYGTPQNDQPYAITKALDGGFIIAGATFYDNIKYNGFLLKLDSTGNQVWAKTYSSNYLFNATVDVVALEDNGYLQLFNGDSCSVIRVDSNGNHMWAKQYISTTRYLAAMTMRPARDGSILMNLHSGGSSFSAVLINIDTSGDLNWTNTYLMPTPHFIVNQFQTKDGDWMFFGNPGALFLTDSLGNLKTAKKYDSLGFVNSVTYLSDNSYLMTGSDISYRTAVTKIDSQGTPLRINAYSPTSVSVGQIAYPLQDTGFLIFGTENMYVSPPLRTVLVQKADAAGLTGCNDDTLTLQVSNWPLTVQSDTILISNLNILVAPMTFQTGSGPTISQICPPTNVDDLHVSEPPEFRLYPNPTTGMLYVESNHTINTITIYSTLGQTILSQNINAHNVSLDLNTQPPGVYFYYLTTTTGDHHSGRFMLND